MNRLWFQRSSIVVLLASGLFAGVAVVNLVLGGRLFHRDSPLHCDHPVYNAGVMGTGERVQHEFRISNTSDREIEGIEVVPECSCTPADISKSRLSPGETAIVTVSVSPRGRPGTFQQTVNLVSASNWPPLSLVITGRAETCFRIKPEASQLSAGEHHGWFDAYVIESHAPIHVSEAFAKDLEADVIEIVPGRHYRVTFTYHEDPSSPHTSLIYLKPLQSPEYMLAVKVSYDPTLQFSQADRENTSIITYTNITN